MTTKFAIFTGPSLQELPSLPDNYDVLPPIMSGDIYKIINHSYTHIAIIDGLFHGFPSIWHREIISAMDEGIEVWGASSMGALRASELNKFGMKGVGHVYTWYSQDLIDGDDEVALQHLQDSPYSPLTVPLVDIRYLLVNHYNLDFGSQAHELLIAAAQQIPYWNRTHTALSGNLLDQGIEPALVSSLINSLRSNPSVKQIDAKNLLSELLCYEATENHPSPIIPEHTLKKTSAIDFYIDMSMQLRSRYCHDTGEYAPTAHLPNSLPLDLAQKANLHSLVSFWIEDLDQYKLQNSISKTIINSPRLALFLDYCNRESQVLTRNEILHFCYISEYFHRLPLINESTLLSDDHYCQANFYIANNPEFNQEPPSFVNVLDTASSPANATSSIALEMLIVSEIVDTYSVHRAHLLDMYISARGISTLKTLPILFQTYILAKSFGALILGCSEKIQKTHSLKYANFISLASNFAK